MADLRVIELRTIDTHDLRARVLRVGTPSTDVRWPGDDLASTVHLGIVDASDTPLAISTWLLATSPDVSTPESVGYQLRGMATDPLPSARGLGLGARLLDDGIEEVRRRGADHVWANARIAALGFYTRIGFTVTSDEFASAATSIPHRRILLRLR